MRALVAGMALASIACSGAREVGDAGGDARVVLSCEQAMRAVGEPCDSLSPTPPCSIAIHDCTTGRSGWEEWWCEGGVVRYRSMIFECSQQCPEYVPASSGAECRRADGCPTGSCWAPGDTSPYYAAGFCPRECEDAAGCAEGQVCVALNGGSCHQCRAACTESSCGRWEVCGDDGHCRPQRCDEGYACHPDATCDPSGGAGFDAHGCSIVACSSDRECSCGSCVLGACALGPGRCEPARP